MLLVELGPEQSEQGIAAMKPARRCDGEIREQPQPLGLLQHGAELLTLRVAEVEDTEGVESNHWRVNVKPAGAGRQWRGAEWQ